MASPVPPENVTGYVLMGDYLDEGSPRVFFTRQLPKMLKVLGENVRLTVNSGGALSSEATEEIRLCLMKIRSALSQCQDSPEVLEQHLENIVAPISTYILDGIKECYSEDSERSEAEYANAVDAALKSQNILFKILYPLIRLSGRDRVINYFSFEYKVIEPVVMFACNLPTNREYWEATYVFALWLSKLCLIPMKLESMDNELFGKKLVERLLEMSKKYAFSHGEENIPGSLLLAMLISRQDVRDLEFEPTMSWILDKATGSNADTREVYCALQVINKIFKMSSKSLYMPKIQSLIDLSDTIHGRLDRYCDLTRAQLVKLDMHIMQTVMKFGLYPGDPPTQDECSGDENSQVELIQKLLKSTILSLEDRNMDVRWRSARSISIITRLAGPSLREGVIGSILKIFDIDKIVVEDEDFGEIRNFQVVSETLWHGACLCISEMIRLCIIPNCMMDAVINVLLEALFFYYRSGESVVGMQVREVACCSFWCMITKSQNDYLEVITSKALGPLLSTSLLDNELTVRRASAATLQELLGRVAPLDITDSLVRKVNHHSVSSRNNSMGSLAIEISDYKRFNRDLLKKLLFHCLDSRDKVTKTVCPRTLAYIAVNHRCWAHSILRRIDQMVRSPCPYSACSAANTLQHIYELSSDTDLCPSELYAATINTLSMQKVSEKRTYKPHILLSIAVCKLIKQICLAPSKLEFLIKYSDMENGEIESKVWNHLFSALKSGDVGLVEEATLVIQLLSRSALALSELKINENVMNVLYNTETAKLDCLQKSILCLLNMDNIDNATIRNGMKILCDIFAEIRKPRSRYSFGYEIRKLIINGLGIVFLRLVATDIHSGQSNDCLLDILKLVISSLDDYTTTHEGDVGSQIRMEASKFITKVATHIRTTDSSDSHQKSLCVSPAFAYECVSKLLRLSVEKIRNVRECAGKALEALVRNTSFELVDGHVLAEVILTNNPEKWSNPEENFMSAVNLVKCKTWRKPTLIGLITTYGALSRSLTGPCTTALSKLTCEICSTDDDVQGHTTGEEFVNLVIEIMIENKNCSRVYHPALELLELLAYDGMLLKCASTSNNRDIISLLTDRFGSSSNIRELCSGLRLCTYMGSNIVACKDSPDYAILLEYMELAISGLFHNYPRLREVAAECLYTSLLISLECGSDNKDYESTAKRIEDIFSQVNTPISPNDAEFIKTELSRLIKDYHPT